MPDKRQESKQRRAARNRANREALAARRENAVTDPSPQRSSRSAASSSRSAASSSPASSSTTAPGGGGRGGAADPPPPGLLGMLRSNRPGDKAVLVAALLAVLGALAMLFLFKVRVDDRGEPIPVQSYGGLTIAAREALGKTVPDRSVTVLDAYGAGVVLYALVPVAVVGFAVWGIRRPDRSRMLTFAMLAMAGVVILGSGVYFFPALIALLVAGFQVRRADLPARAGQPFGGRGGRGGDVIDTTATEGGAAAAGDEIDEADGADAADAAGSTGDEPAGAGDTGEAGAGGTGGEPGDSTAGLQATLADEATPADEAAPPDEAAPDPLAELEAEIEAERAAERGEARPDDEGGRGTSGG